MTVNVLGAVGDNRGSLALDGIDWWSYAGQQGEVLTLSANADYPPDDNLFPLQRIERGQLDTTLRVLGPDGVVLRQNADTFESENAQIRDLALPTSGMYIIEVRPEKYLMQGAYTLVIDSTLP